MKRLWAVLCFLLLLTAVSAALGEASVTVEPECPRVGDYVEVTVTPDRENPDSVSYALFYGPDMEKVFSGKGVQRYSAWCRFRKEGVYTLQITVAYGKEKETVPVEIHVSGEAPAQEGADVIYSQKDGWWKKKKYASTELQTSGCAIFTMSHLLQRMGYTSEDVTPEELAKHYVFYRSGEGTWNEGLVNKCGEVYDFLSQKELLTSTKEIIAALRRGDYFSFSIEHEEIFSFVEQCTHCPTLSETVSLKECSYDVLDLFSRLQERGEIRPFSHTNLGAVIFAPVRYLVMNRKYTPDDSRSELDELVAMLQRMLLM